MKRLGPIVAVILSLCLCCGAYARGSVARSDKKAAVVVSLAHATPSSIIWGLGLWTIDDLLAGTTKAWSATQGGIGASDVQVPDPSKPLTLDPNAPKTPKASSAVKTTCPVAGIDLMVPCDQTRTLIIYGDKALVDEFAGMLPALDVTPKNLQVKLEVIKLAAADAQRLDLSNTAGGTLDAKSTDDLRKSLHEANASWISTPVITTVSSVPAQVSVSGEKQSWVFALLPRIDGDGSITLTLRPKFIDSDKNRTQELYTQRRLDKGEAALTGGFICDELQNQIWFLLAANATD